MQSCPAAISKQHTAAAWALQHTAPQLRTALRSAAAQQGAAWAAAAEGWRRSQTAALCAADAGEGRLHA